MAFNEQLASQVMGALTEMGATEDELFEEHKDLSDAELDQWFNDAAKELGIAAQQTEQPQLTREQMMQVGQETGQVVRQGEAEFIPDVVGERQEEAKGFGFQARAAAARVGQKAGFGLPQKASALVEAGVETVTDKSLMDERGFLGRLKENYNRIIDRGDTNLERAAEANFIVQGLADGAGYYLNPAARFVRGTQLVKGATSVLGTGLGLGAEVGVVEGGEALTNIISRIASGDADLRTAIMEEGSEAALETVIGVGAGAGLKALSQPIATGARAAKPFVKGLANLRKANLSDDANRLIDDASKASRMKNPAAAKEALEKTNQELAKVYDDLNQVATREVADTAEAAKPFVQDYLQQLNQVVNVQARDMLESAATKSSKGLQENLATTANAIGKLKELAQHNYGAELDEIAKALPADTKISFAPAIQRFNETMVDAGLAVPGGKGVVLGKGARQQATKAVEFIEKQLPDLADVNFKSAVEFKQMLGKLIRWGNNVDRDTGEQALLQLWDDVAGTLGEANLGAAGGRYQILRDAYREVLMHSGDAVKASKSLGRLAEYTDEESFLKRLSSSIRSMEEADRISTKLARNKKPIAALAPEDQMLVRDTLKQMRQFYNVKHMQQGNKAAKALRKMATEGADMTEANVEKIRKIGVGLKQLDATRQAVKQSNISTQIRSAIEDPFSSIKRQKAKAYVKDYAGPGKAELESLLNKAAHWERLGGKHQVKANNVLKLLQEGDLAAPAEIAEMRLAFQMEPRLFELVSDAELAKAFVAENPGFLRTIRKPGVQMSEVALGGGAVMGQMGIGFGLDPWTAGTLAVILGLYRTIKNPTGLLMLTERAARPAVGTEAALALSRIAQFAGRASAIIEGVTPEEEQ